MPNPEHRGPITARKVLGAILVLVLAAAGYGVKELTGTWASAPPAETPAVTPGRQAGSTDTPDAGAEEIARAFRDQRSGFMVESGGRVQKILPDDREGSRHQRFIVKLPAGGTVLIAHNIDVAPRVPLDEGDEVTFYGEYEWNDQGGVIHWTHRDSAGRHAHGWIRHEGERYW